jgi:hypothetical protein
MGGTRLFYLALTMQIFQRFRDYLYRWLDSAKPLTPDVSERMRSEIVAYEANRLRGPRLSHTAPTLPVTCTQCGGLTMHDGPLCYACCQSHDDPYPDFTTGPELTRLPEVTLTPSKLSIAGDVNYFGSFASLPPVPAPESTPQDVVGGAGRSHTCCKGHCR